MEISVNHTTPKNIEHLPKEVLKVIFINSIFDAKTFALASQVNKLWNTLIPTVIPVERIKNWAREYDFTNSKETQNHKAALKLYKIAALRGNAIAYNNLGLMYLRGKAVEQNTETAIKLIKKSAELGFVTATFNLGTIYHQGLDIEKNVDLATQYYLEAANKGHFSSINNLWILNRDKIDSKMYTQYVLPIANKGDSEACFFMSEYYYEKDMALAIHYLKKSIEGNPNSIRYVKLIRNYISKAIEDQINEMTNTGVPPGTPLGTLPLDPDFPNCLNKAMELSDNRPETKRMIEAIFATWTKYGLPLRIRLDDGSWVGFRFSEDS